MNYYVPQLANKQPVSVPKQFLAYNMNCLWPLSRTANIVHRFLHKFGITLSLLCFVGTLIGEFTFISENTANIPAMTDCLSTSFMGLQYFIRTVVLAITNNRLRSLFERFYAQIYISDADNEQLRLGVKRNMRIVSIITYIYYLPITLLYINYIQDLYNVDINSSSKPYIYRMSFNWYNAQEFWLFIFTALYTSWLGIGCMGMMSCEDYNICMVLCHTCYRYKELIHKLNNMLEDAWQEQRTTSCSVHVAFRRRLYQVLRQQQHLNSFVQQANAHFTYQIFFTFTFGVLLLCVVLFQFQRASPGIGYGKYIFWLTSQVLQFLMIGIFGHMLMDESFNLSMSYYTCRWEDLLPYGSQRANVNLMRDLQFAILNSCKPINFDGLKLFTLTRVTIGSAFRTSMSYFMFLNTMNNDANKKMK